MPRVLVTGAAGFLGGALVRRLRASGAHEVLAPTRAELDLLAPSAAAWLARAGRVDVLVHAAASRGRGDPRPERFPDEIAINVDATARLFAWARASGVRALVHLSTLSVVRPLADPDARCDERSPLVEAPAPGGAPVHPYALTKRWSEELVAALAGSFEAAAIVRPGMVYGREQSPGSGMGRLVEAVRSGAPWALAGGDGHRYAPVHVDDVVDVLARLVEAPRTVTVIVGGPDALPERALIGDVARALGVAPAFTDAPGPALSMAPRSALADALFPGRLVTPWRDGVARAFGALGP